MTTSSALAASCRPTAVSSSRSNAKLERSCLLRRPAWDAPSTTPPEIAGFDLHIRVITHIILALLSEILIMARFVRQADSQKWVNLVDDPEVNVMTIADMDLPLF